MSQSLIWIHRLSTWLVRVQLRWQEGLLPSADAADSGSSPPFDVVAKAAALSRASYLDYRGFTRVLDVLISPAPPTVSLVDCEECQAYAWVSGAAAHLVFRGTDDALDMLSNVDTRQVDFLGARVHRGFLSRYQAVRAKIAHFLGAHAFDSLLVTGHSMGGALASLAALDLAHALPPSVRVACVTFGSPRVGDARFAALFADRLGVDHWRVFHDQDPVPMVPMGPFYQHVAGHALRVRPTGEWVVHRTDVAWYRRFPLALLSLDLVRPLTAHGTASYVAYTMLLASKAPAADV